MSTTRLRESARGMMMIMMMMMMMMIMLMMMDISVALSIMHEQSTIRASIFICVSLVSQMLIRVISELLLLM